MKKRRLPALWRAEKVEGGYRVKDDHGHWLAFVYAKEHHQVPKIPNYLTGVRPAAWPRRAPAPRARGAGEGSEQGQEPSQAAAAKVQAGDDR